MRTLHMLVILLSFTLDIRVRAETVKYRILEQTGYVEMEQVKQTYDFQTFKKANVRLFFGKNYFGIKENTFISLSDEKIDLHFGSVFIRIPDGEEFLLSTREGVIKSNKSSEFVVTSVDKRTYLSVISGEANLNFRTETAPKLVKAGFQAWIGGLESDGMRATGELEAVSLKDLLDDLQKIGGINIKDLPIASDHLEIAWKKAVRKISEKTQTDVNKNMAILEKWVIDTHKKEMKDAKLRKAVKEYFRAHALDLPYQNKEFPSESPRYPSNSN